MRVFVTVKEFKELYGYTDIEFFAEVARSYLAMPTFSPLESQQGYYLDEHTVNKLRKNPPGRQNRPQVKEPDKCPKFLKERPAGKS